MAAAAAAGAAAAGAATAASAAPPESRAAREQQLQLQSQAFRVARLEEADRHEPKRINEAAALLAAQWVLACRARPIFDRFDH